MKNSNKLFEKQIELKNSQISGGRASKETYQYGNYSYTNDNGCTVIHSEITNDHKQLVEECFFTNCP